MSYTEAEKAIIDQAFRIIESKLIIGGEVFTNSELVKDYCKLHLANLEHEVFVMLLLDNQHRLIKYIELFRGTIDGAAVYPREVVKVALRHNAAAMIMAHCHPSGLADPSQADIAITQRLKTALNTVDIRVLDHLIVGGLTVTSFAERGLL